MSSLWLLWSVVEWKQKCFCQCSSLSPVHTMWLALSTVSKCMLLYELMWLPFAMMMYTLSFLANHSLLSSLVGSWLDSQKLSLSHSRSRTCPLWNLMFCWKPNSACLAFTSILLCSSFQESRSNSASTSSSYRTLWHTIKPIGALVCLPTILRLVHLP